jgi:C4-type Zn-finger protein
MKSLKKFEKFASQILTEEQKRKVNGGEEFLIFIEDKFGTAYICNGNSSGFVWGCRPDNAC